VKLSVILRLELQYRLLRRLGPMVTVQVSDNDRI